MMLPMIPRSSITVSYTSPVYRKSTRTNAIVSVVGINHAPIVPTNPTPADHATKVINTTSLIWNGGDPDGDTIRYDVYFGNTTPLTLIEKDTINTLVNPDPLAEARTYSWQVIARDPDGAETPVRSGPSPRNQHNLL